MPQHPVRANFAIFNKLAAVALCLCSFYAPTAVALEASDVAGAGNQTATQSPAAAPGERVTIPYVGGGVFGTDTAMTALVFLPPGPGPFPVVLFSHGRAGDSKVRADMRNPIPTRHARYWTSRGVAVVAPMRVGYGETGGPDRENSGARYDLLGNCSGRPNFKGLAEQTDRALLSSLDWVRRQPWANRDRILLEGVSVGGFVTIAMAATRPAGVVGYINFSGGAGGSPERSPGHSCDPNQMRDMMAEFGQTVNVPGIWLYAGNDLYWGGDAPKEWYGAFAAGGSKAQMVAVPEVPGQDGHMLLTRGRRLWQRDLDQFAQALGF